jgi:hypothetical protein
MVSLLPQNNARVKWARVLSPPAGANNKATTYAHRSWMSRVAPLVVACHCAVARRDSIAHHCAVSSPSCTVLQDCDGTALFALVGVGA